MDGEIDWVASLGLLCGMWSLEEGRVIHRDAFLWVYTQGKGRKV